jgi:peptidoglycan/LPS O-acetylase OafA/YrhL
MIEENELTRKYFPFLDGLRAVAILWVILHHLPIALPNWVGEIRNRGDLGVELFFSISSFLVFRSLHQCFLRSRPDNFEFIKRRIFRIFPPYFVTLALILGISLFDKGLSSKLVSIKDILLSFPLFFYNYAVSYTHGNVPGSLNLFWSLCFEEQFYITLFLIALISPKKINLCIIFGILFSIGLRIFYYFSNVELASHELQMRTHLRLDAILLGCLFYYYWPQVKRYFQFIPLNIIVVIVAIFLHNFVDYKYQGLLYILISFSFTTLIFNLLNTNGHWVVTLFQNKILAKIGVVSFEIYLLHQIVVGALVKFGLKNYPFLFMVATYVVSIIAAMIMHKVFSDPLNRYLRKKYILNS